MKRAIAILVVLVVSAGSSAALARGSRGGGGGHMGGSPMSARMGSHMMPVGSHMMPAGSHMSGHVVVGVHPGFVHSNHFHSHVHGFSTVVVAAGPFYPYYPYYYYPPAYYPPAYPYAPMAYDTSPTYVEQPTYQPAPAYVQQPTYPQQQAPAAPEIRYYCADTGKYYPDVPTCTTPWMKVVP